MDAAAAAARGGGCLAACRPRALSRSGGREGIGITRGAGLTRSVPVPGAGSFAPHDTWRRVGGRRAGVRVRAKGDEEEAQKRPEEGKSWAWFFEQPSPATNDELDKLLVQLDVVDRSIAAMITEVAIPGTLACGIGWAFGINAFDVGMPEDLTSPATLSALVGGAVPLLALDFMAFVVLPLVDMSDLEKRLEEREVTYMGSLPLALSRYPQWCREQGPLARPLVVDLPFAQLLAIVLASAPAKEAMVRGAALAGFSYWLADRLGEAGWANSLGPMVGPFGHETAISVAVASMVFAFTSSLATPDPFLGFVEGAGLTVFEELFLMGPGDVPAYSDSEARMDIAESFSEASNEQDWSLVLKLYEEQQCLSATEIDYVTVLLACDRLKKWDYSVRVYQAMQRVGAELVPFSAEAVALAAANEGEWAVVREVGGGQVAAGRLTTALGKAMLRAAEAEGDAAAARDVFAQLQDADLCLDEEMWAMALKMIATGGDDRELKAATAKWESACQMGLVAPPARTDPTALTDAPSQGVAGWTEPQLAGTPTSLEPFEVDAVRSFLSWIVLSSQWFATGALAAPILTRMACEIMTLLYVRAGPRTRAEKEGKEGGAGAGAGAAEGA